MKKNIKLILLLSMIISFVSCGDDFLETKPVMSETSSTYYSNDDQMYKALIACYDVLSWCKEQGMAVRVPFSEIRSDNAKTGGGSPLDNAGSQYSEEFINDNSDDISDARWYWNYTGIYRCNLVITADYANRDDTSDDVKQYVAEAKFLRAWYLFELLNTFGPCPIVTTCIIPSENPDIVRGTRADINAQIIKDLTESLVDVRKEKWGDGNVGRISEDLVRSLLGKVYLYQADWNNDDKATFDLAKAQFQKVVNNGNYELMTNYKNIFGYQGHNYSGENNSESIFEIQRCTTAGLTKGSGVHANQFEGNFWVCYAGPRKFKGKSDIYEAGWGFILPTQEVQDYFTEDDSIRLDAYTLTTEEVESTGNGLVWDHTENINSGDWNGCASEKYTRYNNKAYDVVGSKNFNNPGNERAIRYSDVLLMLAECNLRGTSVDEGAAISLINQVRKAHVGSGTDNYLTVDQLKTKYPTRFVNTLDVLWYERRCELAGEGDRWFDIVRTGRAARINKDKYSGWDAMDIYMPIFVNEITATGLSEYPDASDYAGLYPGVIDNTLESCRVN